VADPLFSVPIGTLPGASRKPPPTLRPPSLCLRFGPLAMNSPPNLDLMIFIAGLDYPQRLSDESFFFPVLLRLSSFFGQFPIFFRW